MTPPAAGRWRLNDIAFSGDVRSLAGSVRGDGNFTLSGTRYPFRVSSGQSAGRRTAPAFISTSIPARAPWSVDLDGVLSFEARAPRFEGAIGAGQRPPDRTSGAKAARRHRPSRGGCRPRSRPIHAAAHLEQLEASYGPEETALKLAGAGGRSLRRLAACFMRCISARQLDADRFAAKEIAAKEGGAKSGGGEDNAAAEPVRLLPALRALLGAIPQAPIPARLEFGCRADHAGRPPLQNLAADLHADAKSWTVDRLDFRAPGATRIYSQRHRHAAGPVRQFQWRARRRIVRSRYAGGVAAGPRSELTYRSQKPLRLSGDVSVAADRVAIDAMKAEIDGGAVEGRVALDARRRQAAARGSTPS